MIPCQPLKKGPGLCLLLFVDTGGSTVQLPDNLSHLLGHHREIGYCDPDFMKHVLQRVFQIPEIPGMTVSVNFQNDKGLIGGSGGDLFCAVQLLQFAVFVPLDLKN